MQQFTLAAAARLEAMRDAVSDAVVDRCARLQTGESAVDSMVLLEQTSTYLDYLSQALSACTPELFWEHIAWEKITLAARGVAEGEQGHRLQIIADVLNELLSSDDAAIIGCYLKTAALQLPELAAVAPTVISAEQPLAHLAESYLAALLECQRQKASRLVLDAVQSGTPIKQIYLHVFQQSQVEIGRLWQTNQITVAQEHYCTAATQMIMSQLYPQIFAAPRIGKSFVGASVSSELHEIGIRMVSDFFEMDGWDTVFLGSSVPAVDLIRILVDRKPDVVGISATITTHVNALTQMISAIRAAPGCSGIKIIVGGYPFLIARDLWKTVDADGTASSAQGAVDLANDLIGKRAAA